MKFAIRFHVTPPSILIATPSPVGKSSSAVISKVGGKGVRISDDCDGLNQLWFTRYANSRYAEGCSLKSTSHFSTLCSVAESLSPLPCKRRPGVANPTLATVKSPSAETVSVSVTASVASEFLASSCETTAVSRTSRSFVSNVRT